MLFHAAKRGAHASVICTLKNFRLLFTNSSNLTHAPRNILTCLSGLQIDLDSFVSLYEGTRQGAYTSCALFANGVLTVDQNVYPRVLRSQQP